MTAALPARYRSGTLRCSGVVGFRPGWWGPEPMPCAQTRGLRRVGELAFCAKHREQVEQRARRGA